MEHFCCTFVEHSKLADNFVVVYAENASQASELMYNTYGGTWSMSYPVEKFVSTYLTEVPFGTANWLL